MGSSEFGTDIAIFRDALDRAAEGKLSGDGLDFIYIWSRSEFRIVVDHFSAPRAIGKIPLLRISSTLKLARLNLVHL
jgi:hypothetical protein